MFYSNPNGVPLFSKTLTIPHTKVVRTLTLLASPKWRHRAIVVARSTANVPGHTNLHLRWYRKRAPRPMPGIVGSGPYYQSTNQKVGYKKYGL